MPQVSESDLDAFRPSFTGQVITAADADYDSARSLWNGCFDHHPAVIARCFSSAVAAAEVVLADGRCLRASEDNHPELFWALRGGGGNFGVVTNFEYRLQPVGPEVNVGLLFWDLDHSVEALRLSRDVVADLPRDSS